MKATLYSFALCAVLSACAPTTPTMNPQNALTGSASTGAETEAASALPRMDVEAAEILGSGKYQTATFALG